MTSSEMWRFSEKSGKAPTRKLKSAQVNIITPGNKKL